jgi:hypothetical protein
LKIYLKECSFSAGGKFKVKQVKTFIFAPDEKTPLLARNQRPLLTKLSAADGLPDRTAKRNAMMLAAGSRNNCRGMFNDDRPT